VETTVSALQAVERRRGTINKSTGELCGKEVPRRVSQSSRPQSRKGGYATTWAGWEVAVDITIHDKPELWQKGASGGPLRQKFRARYEKICRQENINDSEVEGRVEFKFTCSYKNPRGSPTTTLGYLSVEPVPNNKHPATWTPMSTYPSGSRIEPMSRTRVRFTEEPYVTQEEPGEAAAALDVPKSPRTPQPRKDKQTIGLVWVSLRFGKLLVAEKGKAITTEIEEDEEDLQALIAQIEAQDEEEEDVFQIPSLPPYISPWKGTTKVPKDLEATKSTLQTPLLPDEIRFDGMPLG